MLNTIGPQDAEQTFPFWLQDGFDYPDYLYAFAPKPYLLLSAIRDFFPIAGARETFAEAVGSIRRSAHRKSWACLKQTTVTDTTSRVG